MIPSSELTLYFSKRGCVSEMSVWSMLKRGLGATDEPTRPDAPTFERLEPRLLLSAGPTGLASLDSLDDGSDFESAIVIDFEPVASDEGLQFPDRRSQTLRKGSQSLNHRRGLPRMTLQPPALSSRLPANHSLP